jgi:hypothetical protein
VSRANLGTDDFLRASHLFPDQHRHRIPIEKSYLLASLSPKAIYVDSLGTSCALCATTW